MDTGFNGTLIFGLGGKGKFPQIPRNRPGLEVSTNYSKEDFLVMIIFLCLKIFLVLTQKVSSYCMFRKVVNWILSVISIFFFWLELHASKCCTCFKEVSSFMRHKLEFLWNTKTYIQDICNINMLFSLNFLYKRILSPIPIWFEHKKTIGPKQKYEIYFCHGNPP